MDRFVFVEDMDTPTDALEMALRLIAGYQADIRNAEWTGVDLLAVGFCQGSAQRHLTARLHGALVRFRQEQGHPMTPYVYVLPNGDLRTIDAAPAPSEGGA